MVPGQELTGTVAAADAGVSGFAPGDPVVIGTLVDSCKI